MACASVPRSTTTLVLGRDSVRSSVHAAMCADEAVARRLERLRSSFNAPHLTLLHAHTTVAGALLGVAAAAGGQQSGCALQCADFHACAEVAALFSCPLQQAAHSGPAADASIAVAGHCVSSAQCTAASWVLQSHPKASGNIPSAAVLHAQKGSVTLLLPTNVGAMARSGEVHPPGNTSVDVHVVMHAVVPVPEGCVTLSNGTQLDNALRSDTSHPAVLIDVPPSRTPSTAVCSKVTNAHYACLMQGVRAEQQAAGAPLEDAASAACAEPLLLCAAERPCGVSTGGGTRWCSVYACVWDAAAGKPFSFTQAAPHYMQRTLLLAAADRKAAHQPRKKRSRATV